MLLILLYSIGKLFQIFIQDEYTTYDCKGIGTFLSFSFSLLLKDFLKY